MTTSSKVSKLPNMQFRVWRVAARRCKSGVEAINFCRANGVACNPIHISKLNPDIRFARK